MRCDNKTPSQPAKLGRETRFEWRLGRRRCAIDGELQ